LIGFEQAGRGFKINNGQINWVLRDITAVIPNGISVVILGKPNSGKSTLINLVAGNDVPSEGRILRQGRFSWPFWFKNNLNFKLTYKQNLRFYCDIYGRDFRRAYAFVDEFGEIGRSMDQTLKTGSNDLRNRFMLASFLAMEFSYFLVDENLNMGDVRLRAKLSAYIEQNRDRFNFFIATSDARLAKAYADLVAVLEGGQLKFFNSVEDGVAYFENEM
jgi:capsular polysaccharide transport system ATP-binding protein